MQIMTWKLNVFKKRALLISFLLIIIVYNYANFSLSTEPTRGRGRSNSSDKAYRESAGYKALLRAHKRDGGRGCVLPTAEPGAPEGAPHLLHAAAAADLIQCPGMDWVECNVSTCGVKEQVLEKYASVRCEFTAVVYDEGAEGQLLPLSRAATEGGQTYALFYSDHAAVSCSARRHGAWLYWRAWASWSGIVTGFRPIDWHLLVGGRHEGLQPYDFLVVGLQSASRTDFQGTRPRSYRALTEDLGAVVMEGYHVVGEGVLASLAPVLTGRLEQEMPDTRKKTWGHENELPAFMWDYLAELDYESAVQDDSGAVEGLLRRQAGERPPLVEHLATHVWAARRCLGDSPVYHRMLDSSLQFLTEPSNTNRKFVFNHIADVTQDGADYMSVPDDYLSQWLLEVKRSGILKNTLLIVMSDYGSKYSAVAGAAAAWAQARLPLLALALPELLLQEDPQALAHLRHNSKQLTVPFDVFATILDLVELRVRQAETSAVPGGDVPRARSLLTHIPESRSCPEAGIEPRWCLCRPRYPRTKDNARNKKIPPAGYEN